MKQQKSQVKAIMLGQLNVTNMKENIILILLLMNFIVAVYISIKEFKDMTSEDCASYCKVYDHSTTTVGIIKYK